MAGEIRAIFVSAKHGEAKTAVDGAELRAGVGLVGDRYAHSGGGIVSLIEAEAVAAFNEATGLSIRAADTYRNVVTQGIGLNPLVGKRFRLGEALVEGFELCEPCATLGWRLATDRVSAVAVVRAFTHAAGIRARVIETGRIAPGAEVSAD